MKRQKHQLRVYARISLKSQVAVCFVYILYINNQQSTIYCVMFLYQLSGSCGTPRSLSNGERSYSSTIVGSTVTYTCDTGYLRTAGSSSKTCQSNGQWSGSHPICTRKSTLCHFISFTYQLQTCKRIASIFSIHNNPFHFQKPIFPSVQMKKYNFMHAISFWL